jgi:hypothetical protein
MANKIKHIKQSTVFDKTKRFANAGTGIGKLTPNNEKIISLIELAVAVVLMLVILFLHFIFLLNAGPLWRDEICIVNLSNLPSITQFWEMLKCDSYPVLWYSLLKVWTLIGFERTDFALRVLGMIVGFCILGALWYATRSLGARLPLISLALFAMCPVILIGDNMKAYGMGTLLILLSFGTTWRAFQNPTPWLIIASAISVFMSVQCLYHNSFLILAICSGAAVAGIYRRDWKLVIFPLGVGLLAAISVLPYFEVVSQRNDWDIIMKAPVDVFWIINKFQQAIDPSGAMLSWIWALLVFLALISFIIILAKPVSDPVEYQRDIAIFLLTTMLLSIVAYMAFLKILSYPTQDWYFLPLMAMLIVIIEKGVDILCKGSIAGRIIRIVFVIGIVLFIFTDSWTAAHARTTNIDLLAAKLETLSEQNDLIVIRPFYYGITFNRYYKGTTPWITLPEIKDFGTTRQDILKLIMTQNDPLRPSMQKIIKTLQNGHRIWFVGSLKLPRPGEIPIILSPAPHSPYGWSEVAYQIAWSRQTAYILQSHAMFIKKINIPLSEPVFKFENAELVEVSGWRY